MPLADIEVHRRAVADVVRRERREYDNPIPDDIDVDVSLFLFNGTNDTFDGEATGADKKEHRRLACEAKAELWKSIRDGEVENVDGTGEALQSFEEWSHTE